MSAELAEAPRPSTEAPRPAPVRPRTEGPRNPEREPLGGNPFVAVEGRIILGGENLDPNKKDVRLPTVDDLNKPLNYDPFRGASMAERREQAKGDVNNWITETTTRFNDGKAFFNDSKDGSQGKRWSAFFKDIGINAKEFTEDDAKKFYEEHFAKGKDQGESLAKKIAEASGYDLTTFEKNHDAISWLGAMCGKDGKVALEAHARIEIRKHEKNAEGRKQWIEEMAADNRINKLGTEQPDEKYGHLTELKLDEYLWRGQQEAEKAKAAKQEPPHKGPIDGDEPIDGTGGQEVLPPGEYSTKQIFEKVKGEVVKDHEYFVANPPDEINIEGQDLKLIKPLYINVEGEGDDAEGDLNPEAKPFYNVLKDHARYNNGEGLTKNDSSLVALAAASSGDPDHQAKLYGDLAKAILAVHAKDKNLIEEWFKHQYQSPGDKTNSLALLKKYDRQRQNPNEKLLVKDGENINEASLAGFKGLWNLKVVALQQALENNKLNDYQLRWIEFLSHSVDVNKLMKLAKDQQPTGPTNGHDAHTPDDHSTPTDPHGGHDAPKDDHKDDGHGGGHDDHGDGSDEKNKDGGIMGKIKRAFKWGRNKGRGSTPANHEQNPHNDPTPEDPHTPGEEHRESGHSNTPPSGSGH